MVTASIAAGIYMLAPAKQGNIYLTEQVKKGDISTTVITTGTVRSNNRVNVGAQVSGKVTEMTVALGDSISKGQLIARIDSTTKENDLKKAESQLATYRAEYESKKVTLDVAQRNFTRVSTLAKTSAVSRETLDTASDTLATARADLQVTAENIKQAEIAVSSARTELDYTTIVSPIDGVVISVPVSVGQTVNSSMETPTIVQIADLTTMLIKLEIPEGDVTRVREGMNAQFSTLADPDIQYQEAITSVDPGLTTLTDNNYSESVTNTDAVYYYANVIVENPQGKLRIGMSTEGSIEIDSRKDVLLVPALAVKKQQGKSVVYLLGEDNVKTERVVQTGISNEFMTEIVAGLREGDKVILSELSAGEKVGNTMPSPI
ncbi:efflux RND transporter periplasmic adaptor subunit [Entomohabitans teleogrylli]|uniref:efflux RND transporter periplasmic adaptor subunit n=1 Tax=Entomohabitans teleogrylli TaxID=1384589 RepID=UPI002012CEFA|nr:efflux RND transporter periplasmic adaptor subunit [Entomohabitans teleogrylli]